MIPTDCWWKRALVGRRDLVEALLIFVLAGQHDLHELARLAHDPVAIRIAPLARLHR